MASEKTDQGGQTLSSGLHFLKNFTLNLWRRLLMLWHYTVICVHQQCLRRAWRRLGERVHQAVDQGEVNPMLTAEVKDSLAKAQDAQAKKDRHYEAVAALREKIQASKAEEPPVPQKAEPAAPPMEAEPPPAAEPESAPPPQPEAAPEAEPEAKSEPIILGPEGPAAEPTVEEKTEAEAEAPKEPESEPEKPQT